MPARHASQGDAGGKSNIKNDSINRIQQRTEDIAPVAKTPPVEFKPISLKQALQKNPVKIKSSPPAHNPNVHNPRHDQQQKHRDEHRQPESHGDLDITIKP